ncbi:MAG: M23 family metallopeptidase, partial [Spirochaetaceae bacterium]
YEESVTYPPFYEWVVNNSSETLEILSLEKKESLARLRELFANPQVFVSHEVRKETPELTQLTAHNEQQINVPPVEPISRHKEKELRGLVADNQKQADAMAQYARSYTDEWVEGLRAQQRFGSVSDIQQAINDGLAKPAYAPSREETQEKIIENIVQEFSSDKHAAETVIRENIKQDNSVVEPIWTETATNVIGFAAFSDPAVSEILLPRIIETAAASVFSGDNIDTQAITETARVLRVATAVETQAIDINSVPLNELFPGISAADAGRPEAKEAVFREVFRQALEKAGGMEGVVAEMTKRIGADAVNSPPFQKILASGNQIASTSGSTSVFHGLEAAAGDFVSTVTTTPREDVYLYFQTVHENVANGGSASLSANQFVTALMYANAPLRWGAESAAKGIVKEVAKKGLVKTTLTAVGAFFGTTFGPVGTIVGGFLTDVVLTKVLSVGGTILGAAAQGFGYFAQGGFLEGKSPPLSLAFMIAPLLVCGAIVLLFVSPTFFNIQSFPDFTRRSALVTSYGLGGGLEGPGVIDCDATPEDPLCKVESCVPQKAGDCAWPTTGILTQGPYTQCVIGGEKWSTHDRLNAIDISAPYGTTVISIKSGEISTWRSGCPDQPGRGDSTSFGCNGGWGNYVDIASDDGYVLRYGHLALGAMSLTHLHMKVNQGQVVGKVDNNGNSYGNHLHFGLVTGPGGILSVLPLGPADANRVNRCALNSNCPVVCPRIYASTQ